MNIKLHIDQSDHLTNRYISELTNHARVDLEKMNYDPKNKLAVIPLTRYRVVSVRKLLRFFEHQRDYNNPIQSRVIIRNIQNAEMEKADTCNDIKEITLIFGINIKKNEIFFGSAEEASGKHCYGASFFGDNLILELEDIENI